MRQGPFSWNNPIILELPGYANISVAATYHDNAPYSAVEPDRERCRLWVLARLEKPEPVNRTT